MQQFLVPKSKLLAVNQALLLFTLTSSDPVGWNVTPSLPISYQHNAGSGEDTVAKNALSDLNYRESSSNTKSVS